VKDAAYECGVEPVGNARARFSVKFYLVAVLFIVFDIETVFLVPWATIYFGDAAGTGPSMGFLLVEALVFIGILLYGLLLGEGGALTPIPTPGPTPSITAEPSGSGSPAPSASSEPSASVAPSSSPTPVASPSAEPSATSSAEPSATSSAEPSASPS